MNKSHLRALGGRVLVVLALASCVGCTQTPPTPAAQGQPASKDRPKPETATAAQGQPASKDRPKPETATAGPQPGAPVATPVAAKPDPDLQGTWKLDCVYTRNEDGNQSYGVVTSPQPEMTIEGNNVTVRTEAEGKQETEKYTLDLDQSKTPKVYRRVSVDAAGKSRTRAGIYAVLGKDRKDMLWMCDQADGQPPESFTVVRDDGKGRRIWEYRRTTASKSRE